MTTIPAPTIIRANPYVGPRSFKTNEKLYGRDRELRQLTDRLISERIVLLHSPSGAGKTSLVQAGLIPKMLEEDFYVNSMIRVNLERTRDLPCAGNRYILSTLLSLEEGYPEEERLDKDLYSCMSLDDYLTMRATRDKRTGPELLIFDQFEEVLTIDPSDREGKLAFFNLLGTALKNRDRWAMFVMREDYVASLEPYVRAVPTYFANTFRLDLLGVAAARDAMQSPARDMGVEFVNDAANKLIDDLRRIQVMGPEGGMESILGLYVEPVQLQVVCYRLWETLDENDTRIDLNDIAAIGDVDKSLSEYYALSVAGAAKQAEVSERTIREWFENRLITKEGIRGQVLMGTTHSEGLENKAVHLLENAHIIRAEKRAGATWYELAHDRLIEPVRKSNHAWFEANLNLLQRQAALWELQNRSDGLLIRGKDLSKAKKQAATITLTSIEQDFLTACGKLRKAEQRERLRNRIIMGLGIVAGIAFIVAMVFYSIAVDSERAALASQAAAEQSYKEAEQARVAAVASEKEALNQKTIAEAAQVEAEGQRLEADSQRKDAETQRKEAEASRREAFARQLAAQASLLTLERGRSALFSGLLSVEAARRLPAYEADQSLRRFLDQIGLPVWQYKGSSGVFAIQFIEGGTLVATASNDGAVLVKDVATGEELYLVTFGGGITDLKYNAASGQLAAGSMDGTAKIWDAATGNNLIQVNHGGLIAAIDFRPDGQQLVTGSDDGTVKLWSTQTGDLLNTREAVIDPGSEEIPGVLSLAFSNDGKQVAASFWNKPVAILNAVALYPLFSIIDENCPGAEKLVYSPDGNMIAGICGTDVVVWRTINGQEISRKTHKYGASGVHFSQDSKLILSTGYDFIAMVWEVSTGKEISKVKHFNTVNAAVFSDNQQLVVSSSDDGTVRVWDAKTGQEVSRMLYDSGVQAAAFSPNGQTIASGTIDGSVTLWNIHAARKDNIPIFNQDVVSFAGIRSDGRQAYVANDTNIVIFETASGNILRTESPEGGINAVAYSPDGTKMVVAGLDKTVRVFDVNDTWREIARLAHDDTVSAVAFSPDGQYIVSGGDEADKTARVWETATGKEIQRVTHDVPVTSVAFSPDGEYVLSGGREGDPTVRVWSAVTGTEKYRVTFAGAVLAVAVSPDGQWAASANDDFSVTIWDAATGEKTVSLQLNEWVRSVSFSPDSQWILTASWDGSAQVWDVASGDKISSMIQDDRVEYAVFSPDGKYVASGSQDRTVRVWEAKTGNEIARISHPDWVTALVFSPDSKHILSGSFVGATYWSTQVDDLITETCKRLPRNFSDEEWNTYFSGEPYRETCKIGAVASAQTLLPAPTLPMTASGPGFACSINSDQPVQITFQNHSGRDLDVYWSDFSCVPQYYLTLKDGEEYDQDTFVSYPWEFVDPATGETVLEYITAAGDSVVEVK